jgi:hypothetical protein
MSTDIEDPFALPDESRVTARESILSRGRYMLPNRDGSHKARGFQRVSNLVSAFSDQFGLRMWELGEVLQGVAMSPELYAALLAARLDKMDRPTRKQWVESFIQQAKDVSGGNYGSKYGSQRHAVVEEYHAGLPVAHYDAGTRQHVALYAAALQRNGLVALPVMQERRVLVEELECVGTLDNILGQVCNATSHGTGEPCPECFNNGWTNPVIGDLKTQRKFWTWLEISAQFACYAHGTAMWNEAAGCWEDMPVVSQETGMVLWMPRHPDDPEERKLWEPHVDVYEVDLVEGWKTARLAYQVVQARARGKSAANPLGRLRAAPEPTEWEKMAARFAACESLADGRALVKACQANGMWDEAMARAAQEAYTRLAVPA